MSDEGGRKKGMKEAGMKDKGSTKECGRATHLAKVYPLR